MSSPSLLEVDNLSVRFQTRHGPVDVLDKVSLAIKPGRTLAVVGESGSGKSVSAFTALGILDAAGEVTGGQVRFDGRNLLGLSAGEFRQLRGRDIAMIFQNPRTALNPIRTVGQQIEDVLASHTRLPRKALRDAAIEQLMLVRITDPARRYHAYPFELSGGMCQRVMIAIALACKPRLLIADEPTTGLDLTTQRVIMDLIQALATEHGMATWLITHDLGLAADYADDIAVMHAGQVLEIAPAQALFKFSRHPYTRRLLAATPRINTRLSELLPVAGQLPDLRQVQPHCRFSSRCDRCLPECSQSPLSLIAISPSHQLACRNPL
jgi:peptide/nickel transport system ATP-binding protein